MAEAQIYAIGIGTLIFAVAVTLIVRGLLERLEARETLKHAEPSDVHARLRSEVAKIQRARAGRFILIGTPFGIAGAIVVSVGLVLSSGSGNRETGDRCDLAVHCAAPHGSERNADAGTDPPGPAPEPPHVNGHVPEIKEPLATGNSLFLFAALSFVVVGGWIIIRADGRTWKAVGAASMVVGAGFTLTGELKLIETLNVSSERLYAGQGDDRWARLPGRFECRE